MVERAGCVTGPRGFGSRKFKGVMYDPHKVYVCSQPGCFDHEKQDILIAENIARMNLDRERLIAEGNITKVVQKDCGQIQILYIRRKEI